ncbi:MAG: N-acetylmuramoyl-L-alanine amidase family protein [Thermovirgaceae bacterium]
MFRSRGFKKPLLCFLACLILVMGPSGAYGLTLSRDGSPVGALPEKTHQGAQFVPVGRMAETLGCRTENTGDSLLVHGQKTTLKLVPGATAAILQGQIIALTRNMMENGGWWIEKNDALKVFGRFLALDSGRDVILSWDSGSGKATSETEKPGPLSLGPEKSGEPSKDDPRETSQTGPSGKVNSLRWGIQDFGLRAVIDYSGAVPVKVSSEAGCVDVTIQGIALPGAASPSPSPGKVEASVSQFGDRVLFSFLHRARKIEHFRLENPQRYVVDFYDPQPLKSQAPSLVLAERVNPEAEEPLQEDEPEADQRPLQSVVPVLSPQDDGKYVVVIDPGHGGKDPGAVANGLLEKDINLKVGRYLADALKSRGIQPVFTRSTDVYLKLSDRTNIAMKNNADLFVSLHCNALPAGRHARGVEIYLMALPTDEHAMELARIENKELTNGGAEAAKAADKRTQMLLKILGDMQQNAKIQESTGFAEALFSAGKQGGLSMRRVAQAPFYVLRGASMPSVLIEMGFLTEASEAAQLKRSDYQKKLASFIARGVMEYLGK